MTWTDTDLLTWVQTLYDGGVAIAPAEGVYGYVADPFKEDALRSLLAKKKRSADKGLIVLVADRSDLKYITDPLTGKNKTAVDQFWWAGAVPTTLVLPAKERVSELITGGRDTVAVRRPYVPYMQSYLNAWKAVSGHGILVSSSVNTMGEPPVLEAKNLPKDVVALTHSEVLLGRPSRLYDPQTDTFLR